MKTKTEKEKEWTEYHIRFNLSNGKKVYWIRFGTSLEQCLTLTKDAAAKEFGVLWKEGGGIEICGPQGESKVYSF